MQEKSTDELLSIWKENDKRKYSKEDFDAIQKVLSERIGILPEQKVVENIDVQINHPGKHDLTKTKITSTNAIFGEEVFLISDITSASVFQSKSSIVSSSIAFIMGLTGIIFFLVGLVFSINLDLVGYSIFGLILIGVAKFIESPTYRVEIVTSSGKIEVFESRNQAKCKKIVDRLNEEIAKKEESPASKENHVSV